MKKVTAYVIAFAACLLTGNILAYERLTHEYLSEVAADRSVLNGGAFGSILNDIGAPAYSAAVYTASNGAVNQTVELLIRLGANAEDDGLRFLAHFFAPQYNNFEGAPLSFLIGHTSPDWAIEDAGNRNIDTSNVPFVGSLINQDFSYREARRYFRLAMTSSSTEARQSNLALMFESLGHIIHHIQDMAQPQHTRDDPHIPAQNVAARGALNFFGIQPVDASIYEGFTAAEYPTKAILENFVLSSPFIFYMQTPVLPTIRHYWHTPGTTTDVRVGMAEFASQNYVSSGSLFTTSTWPYGTLSYRSSSQLYVPLPDGSNTFVDRRNVVVNYADGTSVNGDIDFIVGDVRDDFNGGVYQDRDLATVSLVLGLSQVVPVQRRISINRVVFKGMHEVLLPRAVAFSTGVINHFFSGRLNVERTPDESNSWQVTNMSSKTMSGAFTILFESDTGVRSQYAAKVATLLAGQSVEIVSPEPPKSTTSNVIAVFEGSLGAETNFSGGVAGARVAMFTDPPDDSIACGTQISAAGSSEGLSVPVYELGTTPGAVQLEFQAYYIPDAITLRANNAAQTVLASSNGLTQGYHLYNINYDPVSLGTTTANLTVDGNQDPNTRWTATLGCPGQILDNSDRQAPLVPVTFQYGGSDDGRAIGSCMFELYIDGQRRLYVITNSYGATFTLNLFAGIHQFDYVNKSCTALSTLGGFRSTYTDSAGVHSIANPYYSGRISGVFEVATP